jgi:hypothetical protein
MRPSTRKLRAHLAGTPDPDIRQVSARQYNVRHENRLHIYIVQENGDVATAGSVSFFDYQRAQKRAKSPNMRYTREDTASAVEPTKPRQLKLL